RYEVRSKLGGGGMGGLFLGYDPRLGREVAIKVIGGGLSDKDQSRQRFYREVQLMASLSHAAIVPIYDFGEQDQQPYLAMRLMRGGSLTQLLHKKGRFTLAEVTLMFERLAPALDMAHGRGVVHRDLKPDNILLDQFGYPAITNFGLVKLFSASKQTKTGRVMGTLHCMSPEQGRDEKVIDHRADIYALGVVLFKLLTGQWPYEADHSWG
ncbi:MAG: serine/threonine-protein kinase, partial [Ardenticatenaceae bacterium]